MKKVKVKFCFGRTAVSRNGFKVSLPNFIMFLNLSTLSLISFVNC